MTPEDKAAEDEYVMYRLSKFKRTLSYQIGLACGFVGLIYAINVYSLIFYPAPHGIVNILATFAPSLILGYVVYMIGFQSADATANFLIALLQEYDEAHEK